MLQKAPGSRNTEKNNNKKYQKILGTIKTASNKTGNQSTGGQGCKKKKKKKKKNE